MTIRYSTQTQPNLFSPTDIPAELISQAAFHDLICFSHLRWNFVYQRPQHLMSQWAGTPDSGRCRVWYIEELDWGETSGLSIWSVSQYLSVVVSQLRHGTGPDEAVEQQRAILDQLLAEQHTEHYILW